VLVNAVESVAEVLAEGIEPMTCTAVAPDAARLADSASNRELYDYAIPLHRRRRRLAGRPGSGQVAD
jgi:hypothetical protein